MASATRHEETAAPGPGPASAAAAAVFLVSALVLALQIAFIRALSLDTYHHFTYLVISIALLGFGASGTALSVFSQTVRARFFEVSATVLVLLVLSAAWAYRVAVLIRPDMQYVLYSAAEVLKLWAHALVLFLPFFFGGLFVGMNLGRFSRKLGVIYGANMTGSGLGGVAGVGLAFVVGPYRMPAVIAFLGVAALLVWRAAWPAYRGALRGAFASVALVVAAGAAGGALFLPVGSSVDPYKPMAHAERLVEQGDARHLLGRDGPRARIDVFDVPSTHHTLFAAPDAPTPPPQLSLFLDGAHAGGIFRIEAAEQAPVLRHTAQSLAYHVGHLPRVLILGETAGVNVWLALAHGAEQVTVVQANPQLTQAVRETVPGGASVFHHPAVEVIHEEPRLFLERLGRRSGRLRGRGPAGRNAFDIIHLAEAEGMPAGAGGLASMREDYLLTEEAVQAALSRLAPGGLLTVTRGMQTPPRDNVRLFALLAEAIRAGHGDENPRAAERAARSRLLQARNYLAVTTIAAARDLSPRRVAELREAAAALAMDVDYFPGITPDDLTARNRVPGPVSGPGSYYYDAAQRLLAGPEEREAFYRGWVYDVRPPTDARPYFHSFFRWGSLGRYVESYGRFWFQRLELGYAVVVITFVQVLLSALLLVLLPVVLVRRRSAASRRSGGRLRAGGRRPVGWILFHFTAIGLGFLLLEMLHIQRLTRFLGDPIYATAAVLTAILVFSGVGSYAQGRLPVSAAGRIRAGGLAVAALALLYHVILDPVLGAAGSATEPVRFATALAFLFPISFMMGWLMPAGLELGAGCSRELIPVAWATNGVASVAATPLSVMVAAGGGFLAVTLLAAACYALVALAVPVRISAHTPTENPM